MYNKYRRFTLEELNMFIDYLDKKINEIENIGKLNNNRIEECKKLTSGIRVVKLDLLIERKRRYEV